MNAIKPDSLESFDEITKEMKNRENDQMTALTPLFIKLPIFTVTPLL